MPSLIPFVSRLPYPRLICLILAAIQLMSLPESPEPLRASSTGLILDITQM